MNPEEVAQYILSLPVIEYDMLGIKKLREFAIQLGISGVKSIQNKDYLKFKIDIACKAHTRIPYFEVPSLIYLIFDTETTLGFGSGRLLQLSYSVFSGPEKIYERNDYILPGDFTVDGEEIHGITRELLLAKGIPIIEALEKFVQTIENFNVEVLVAHNFPFDKDVLQRESQLLEKPLFGESRSWIERKLSYIDTARNSAVMTYAQVRSGRNRCVFPKLQELAKFAIDDEAVVEHSADKDVFILSKVLFHLFSIGILSSKSCVDL